MPNQEELSPAKRAGASALPPLTVAKPAESVAASRSQFRTLAVLTAVLVCCFAKPLFDLFRFALHSDLFSHTLLIPFISAYLIWINKASLPPASNPSRPLALIPLAVGLVALARAWFVSNSSVPVPGHDYLTYTTLSCLFLFYSACFFTFGPATLRAIAFPLVFLIFVVPFPGFLVDAIETLLQQASALTADLFFTFTGMTFLRDGLLFQLPGIRLQVAPECSGIHSSLVLFITSLVAGRLFLNKFSNRVLLAVAVIPLGILRNAFRIWSIGELCVHISPQMIDSPIHHHGGPIFFIVSLVPLFLLLYYQRRSELKNKSQAL